MSAPLLVGDVFRNAASAVPGRVAAFLDDRSLTFGALDVESNRTARALCRVGVTRGDRVVVYAPTTLDSVVVFAALAKVGAAFSPVNGGLGAEEVAGIVHRARPALILVDRDRLEAGHVVGGLVGVRVLDMAVLVGTLAGEEDGADYTEPALVEADAHVVFFTSGSTGPPKGAVVSHRASVLRSHPGSQLEPPRGALVCPYPLFHMGAFTLAMQQWHARDAIVLLPSADAPVICAAIERHGATRINAIPAVWGRVLDHLATPDGKRCDLSSLRLIDTGTSATPLELLRALEDAMPNARVRVFYGSTEAAAVTALDPADVVRKPGSVGVVAPLAAIRVVDGELWCRGPLLFDGYFDDPAATAEALVDGWYRSGDLVEVDDEGFYRVVGRVRDIIRTGGETVAPAEVEAVVALHPAVADVAAFGLPDALYGERVCVALVVAPGAAVPTVEELRGFYAPRLARFKHPRQIAVVDAIPRTAATRQVQRRLLVERLS